MKKITLKGCRLSLSSILIFTFLPALFSTLLFSCQSPHPSNNGPLHIKVEFNEQFTPGEIEKHISSFEIIPIEYSVGNEMGRLSKISGSPDRIVIYIRNINAFWILDNHGKILNKINKSGKGPGEYGGVSDITLNPGGNLELIDPIKMKLLEYSLEGNIVNETDISGNFETIEYLDNKSRVIGSYRLGENDQAPDYYINILSKDFVAEKQLLPFYTSWSNGGIAPDLVRMGRGVGISKIGDYSYYFLDEKSNIDTLLVFDFGANGYDFSHSDRMQFEDFIQILGQNLAKPIGAGVILPQEDKFLANNMFKGAPYFGVGTWNVPEMVFMPVQDFKFIGSYKGFPVPMSREIVNGKIAGSLEAMDIIEFWEKFPDEKARAEKEPDFKKVISQLDADDNPLLIFFTLGR
jgi:hypothetical protein